MYKDEPWTLNEKKEVKKTSKVMSYLKKERNNSEIAVMRVKKFVELHKDKVFTIAQLADALDLSEGTVSSTMNRLATLGEVNVVYMQRPHWSPVFQHASAASSRVDFVYKGGDPIIKVKELFERNVNEVYSKAMILKEIEVSESMLNRCLQIYLTNGTLKLVGTIDGCAQYQHRDGDKNGYEIYADFNDDYMALSEYLHLHNLEEYKETFIKELKGKDRFYYTGRGLRRRYPIEAMEKIAKKVSKKSILSGLFGK